VKLGTENRRNTILAAVLGVLALLAVVYELMPATSTVASTSAGVSASASPAGTPPKKTPKLSGAAAGKKQRAPESLDPTLNLHALAVTEQIKYEGSGRNIFVSQAEVVETNRSTESCAISAAGGCASASDSAEVLWLRQSAGRTQEGFSFQGRRRFHCGRRRNCRPPL
jgi:hypothetical protein